MHKYKRSFEYKRSFKYFLVPYIFMNYWKIWAAKTKVTLYTVYWINMQMFLEAAL